MIPRPGFDSILRRHLARQVEWERCRATPRRVTPSALAGGGAEVVFPHTTPRRDAELGRLVGVCAHEVLEQWDFTRPDAEIHTGIMQTIRHSVAQDHPELIHEITENLTSLFEPVSLPSRTRDCNMRPCSGEKSRVSCHVVRAS